MNTHKIIKSKRVMKVQKINKLKILFKKKKIKSNLITKWMKK